MALRDLPTEQEEWEGLREWQHAREVEAAVEVAARNGDLETLYLLQWSVSEDLSEVVEMEIYRHWKG